jgi:hypothetical protein
VRGVAAPGDDRGLTRYRNWNRATGEAAGGIAASVVVWAVAAWIADEGILGARRWQRLDRTGAATQGVWVAILILSVVALLAVCAAVIVRAARHGGVVSDNLLVVRSVFSTVRIPIVDIAAVHRPEVREQWSGPSAPWTPPERWLQIQDTGGRRVSLGWLARPRPPDGAPPLGALLDRLVPAAAGAAPPRTVVTSPIARARDRKLLACTMTALLLVGAGAVFTASDWHDERVAEQRRTASVDASVTGVDFVDGDAGDEPRSDIQIIFTAGDTSVRGEVSKPGRAELQIEDVVGVVYDPHDVTNVELAARPPVDPSGYRALVRAGLVATMAAAAVLTWMMVASVSRRRAGCA